MITNNVGIRERSFVRFVQAELEALECQDEVCLVVNLPIRGMPNCCPRQFVWLRMLEMESRWFFAISVVCVSNARSFYCPCPVLVCVSAYFDIAIPYPS